MIMLLYAMMRQRLGKISYAGILDESLLKFSAFSGESV
jgi:hypothetical protein